MLLAIGLQESEFVHRRQMSGPARGYWQFELSGVEGVLSHHSSAEYAIGFCRVLNYEPDVHEIYGALEDNDVLAAGFARLLLWRLPDPLPTNATDGWNQYIETWRPGKPRRSKWQNNWATAIREIQTRE
jgi:hypothetical protein